MAAVDATNFSYLDGGPIPQNGARTLGEGLRYTAQNSPEASATCTDFKGQVSSLTYTELLAAATSATAALEQAGVVRGDRVLLLFRNPADFVIHAWACFLGGFAVAPISCPLAPNSELAFAARVAAAHAALDTPWVLLGGLGDELPDVVKAFPSERTITQLEPATADEHKDRGVQGSDVALILLTSGSTGVPKGVPLTHDALLAESSALASAMPLSASDIALNWMPLDHVGGAVMMHLAPLMSGASQHQIAPTHVLERPERWLDLLSETRATVTWAANFAFAKLVERLDVDSVDEKWNLSSLHTIVNGGEVVNFRTASAFTSLLVDAKLDPQAMRPTWGMSETSSGTIMANDLWASGPSEFVCVGQPIPGLQLRLVDDTGATVPSGTVGSLEVCGPMVITSYIDPEHGRAQFVGDGWFATGDLGHLSEHGLVLVGRDAETVIVAGVNHSVVAIETQIATLPFVRPGGVAVVSHRPPGADTDHVRVFVSLVDDQDQEQSTRAVASHVGRQFGVSVAEVVVIGIDDFPRTSLGKIQRRVLIERYAEVGEPVAPSNAIEGQGGSAGGGDDRVLERLRVLWMDALSMSEIDVGDRFFDLGGTSIALVGIYSQLCDDFEVDLELVDLVQAETLGEMSTLVNAATNLAALAS